LRTKLEVRTYNFIRSEDTISCQNLMPDRIANISTKIILFKFVYVCQQFLTYSHRIWHDNHHDEEETETSLKGS